MEIANENEKPAKDGVRYMMRGPNIDWGVIDLEPGMTLKKHYHEEVEETFFVVSGTVTFQLQDQEMEASAGTAVRMEPTEQHGLTNNTEEPVRVVFMKHIYRPEDKVSCEDN